MSLVFRNVVADENIPREVVESLRGLGFREVYSISENKPGIPDTQVWQIATRKQAILLTGDLGFLHQLREAEVLGGPEVIEYKVGGFDRDELKDPNVMRFMMEWVFRNRHHEVAEYLSLKVEGKAKTRRQAWSAEKQRRRRAGLTV